MPGGLGAGQGDADDVGGLPVAALAEERLGAGIVRFVVEGEPRVRVAAAVRLTQPVKARAASRMSRSE